MNDPEDKPVTATESMMAQKEYDTRLLRFEYQIKREIMKMANRITADILEAYDEELKDLDKRFDK